MTDLSAAARNINWLVENFVDRVPGVTEAVVVSADGLPMAVSRGLDRDTGDRFAAVASGLIGLAYGAAGRFGGDHRQAAGHGFQKHVGPALVARGEHEHVGRRQRATERLRRQRTEKPHGLAKS